MNELLRKTELELVLKKLRHQVTIFIPHLANFSFLDSPSGPFYFALPPFVDFELIPQSESENLTKLRNSFNQLKELCNQSHTSPVLHSEILELLRKHNKGDETKLKLFIYINSLYDDAEYYQYIQDLLHPIAEMADVEICNAHGWKETLERDDIVAEVIGLLRTGLLNESIDHFIDHHTLENDHRKSKIVEIALNLFPEYEYYNTKNEIKSKIDLFLNRLIYGNFTKSSSDLDLYTPSAEYKAKVIKISRTSFGKGVLIFEKEDLQALAEIDEGEQFELLCKMFISKLKSKGKDLNKNQITDYISNNLLTIKEYYPDLVGNTFGLNLIENISKDEQSKSRQIPKFLPLSNVSELKNDEDVWIGSKISTKSDLENTLKNTNLEGCLDELILAIDLLHFLIGVHTKYLSSPEELYQKHLLLCGMDWGIHSNGEEKIVKALEWSGRTTGSAIPTLEILYQNTDENQHQITEAYFYRTVKTLINTDLFIGQNYTQNIEKFYQFMNEPVLELGNSPLKDLINIQSVNIDSEGMLNFGLILIGEASVSIDKIVETLNTFKF